MPFGNVPATQISPLAFPLLAPDGNGGAPSYSNSSSPIIGVFFASGSVRMAIGGAVNSIWGSGLFAPGTNGGTDLGSAAIGWKRQYLDYTNTGTVGAVTINKAVGRVNIAAGQLTIVVTCSFCTAAAHVFPNLTTVDATAKSAQITPAAGSFTVTLNAACTAQVAVDFHIVNAD